MKLVEPVKKTLRILNKLALWPFDDDLQFKAKHEFIKLLIVLLISKSGELYVTLYTVLNYQGDFDFNAIMAPIGLTTFDFVSGAILLQVGFAANIIFFVLMKKNACKMSELGQACYELGSQIGPIGVRVNDTCKKHVFRIMRKQLWFIALASLPQGVLWYFMCQILLILGTTQYLFPLLQIISSWFSFFGPFAMSAVTTVVLFFVHLVAGIAEDFANKPEFDSPKQAIKLASGIVRVSKVLNAATAPFIITQFTVFLFAATLSAFNLSSIVFANFSLLRILQSTTNLFLSVVYFSSLFSACKAGQQLADASKAVRKRLKRLVKEFPKGEMTTSQLYDLRTLIETKLSLRPYDYYSVNHSCYLGATGTCLTYLIVLMQFKQGEDSDNMAFANGTMFNYNATED